MENSSKVLILCMLSKVNMTLLEFEGMTFGLPYCLDWADYLATSLGLRPFCLVAQSLEQW